MTEGESVFREIIDKCTIESFQRVMRDLRDRHPDGWSSCENRQLQLVEMPSTTDRATWYIKVPNDDYKREGWACIEARRRAGEQIQVEIRDDCRASEDRSLVGRVSLREFVALVVSEAKGSVRPEEHPEADAGDRQGVESIFTQSMQTERVIPVEGKNLQDVRDILEENAYRSQDPVMLVLFRDPGCVAGALKLMHTTDEGKRLPDALHRGTLRATPCTDGVRIVFRLEDFPDYVLFWQKVDELQIMLGVPAPMPIEKGVGREGKPTARTEERARVFRRLKEEHPEWTQWQVANKASEELREYVTADTVRNTYRAMGWKWERADRVR